MDKFYAISLDPAQLHDYSPLAVLQVDPDAADSGNVYRLVSLKRKQRLSYVEIVALAKRVFLNPRFQPDAKFIIDVGGVGRALMDMLTAAGIECIPVQLTGGEAESVIGGTYHASKSLLVGRFLAAWDAARVQVPATASFLPILEAELKAFRGAMSAQGRATFEASQGEHDDLVLALAQAVWYFEAHKPASIPPMVFSGGDKKCGWRESPARYVDRSLISPGLGLR